MGSCYSCSDCDKCKKEILENLINLEVSINEKIKNLEKNINIKMLEKLNILDNEIRKNINSEINYIFK